MPAWRGVTVAPRGLGKHSDEVDQIIAIRSDLKPLSREAAGSEQLAFLRPSQRTALRDIYARLVSVLKEIGPIFRNAGSDVVIWLPRPVD